MKMDAKNIVVGAGFTGLTIAERLAKAGEEVIIIEKRGHIGGNCYDEYNKDGILYQVYGPHIFHTSSIRVWDYLSDFTEWIDYKHKVIAEYRGNTYPIPMNLNTINLFFKKDYDAEEAKEFIKTKKVHIENVDNSRDVVLSQVGEELYEAFIRHYTYKQWGMYPEELDRQVLERIQPRFNKNDHYFLDKYQGMPKEGFTAMFNKMASSKRIKLKLNTNYRDVLSNMDYERLFVTSQIDEFFDYKYGKLPYRCIDFRFETLDMEDYQKNSVINYTEKEPPYTRITEYKKLTMQKSPKTTLCKEYPTWTGEPSYPVPKKENHELYEKYKKDAEKLEGVFFLGRLGGYKYLNMDQACNAGLEVTDKILNER